MQNSELLRNVKPIDPNPVDMEAHLRQAAQVDVETTPGHGSLACPREAL